jgi:hypothetical protein
MDHSRFDEITRNLAGQRSRRSMLRALGALTAAAFAGVGVGDAGAAGRCRADGVVCVKNADCCDGSCLPTPTGRKVCGLPPCDPGLTRCGDLCVDLATDPQNCGFCGNVVDTDRGESCCFGNVCSASEFCFSLTATTSFSQSALVTGFCSATSTGTGTGTATATSSFTETITITNTFSGSISITTSFL